VYVITLNWNRCEDTLALLQSCQGLAGAPRLLVVDNASTDGSVERITAAFPEVEQLVNEQNLGFAAGMNVGIRYALDRGAEYLFLVNNDTALASNALQELLTAMAATEAAMASPAIFYADAPQRPWSLGGWRRVRTLEISQAPLPVTDDPFEVDFITGCGMLVHRNCLEQVGLFDEQFFMYYEDADFCLRAQRAGQKMIVVPRARMWHKVATTIGGSDSPAERYYMALSSLLFFKKHVRGWRWLWVGPYRAASAIKTVARLVAGGRGAAARAYLRGLWEGVRA
jgi:GT2 family glycosyltransferase